QSIAFGLSFVRRFVDRFLRLFPHLLTRRPHQSAGAEKHRSDERDRSNHALVGRPLWAPLSISRRRKSPPCKDRSGQPDSSLHGDKLYAWHRFLQSEAHWAPTYFTNQPRRVDAECLPRRRRRRRPPRYW